MTTLSKKIHIIVNLHVTGTSKAYNSAVDRKSDTQGDCGDKVETTEDLI